MLDEKKGKCRGFDLVPPRREKGRSVVWSLVTGVLQCQSFASAAVFIIGGGPAGLATAIAARRRGFEVIVADGNSPSIDKACGEGLMPDGLAALARLGISIREENAFPFRGIRFVSSGLSVAASFPQGTGTGVRRTVLHRTMAEHTAGLGVKVLWRTPVTGFNHTHSQQRRKGISAFRPIRTRRFNCQPLYTNGRKHQPQLFRQCRISIGVT